MPSLPPVSSYKPQSRRTTMGDGRGTGIARPLNKKRRVDSDSSDPSEYQRETQASKKRKNESSLLLDLLESGSESDGDFDPTMKEWLATNTQKIAGNEGGDNENSSILAHERKENDGHYASSKGRVTNRVSENRKGQSKTTKRSGDSRHGSGAREHVARNQNHNDARYKNNDRGNEHIDQELKNPSKGKVIPR